jgi:hypothetical protein
LRIDLMGLRLKKRGCMWGGTKKKIQLVKF